MGGTNILTTTPLLAHSINITAVGLVSIFYFSSFNFTFNFIILIVINLILLYTYCCKLVPGGPGLGYRGEVLFLFTGLEPAAGDAILQPVLQYGYSAIGGIKRGGVEVRRGEGKSERERVNMNSYCWLQEVKRGT
jgi:hypothetical protein